MLALGENGEKGKFLWSLSLLIRPEWYPDSYINVWDYEKVFLKHKCGEFFFTRTQSFA